MSINRDITIESALPVVSSNGLNTNQPVDFTGAATVALPAGTTIGGSAVVALASISSSATTGAVFSVTDTGVYTGVGMTQIIANSATTGVVQLIQANGLTTGTALSVSSTGTIATTGTLLTLTANSATTSTGLLTISGTGLTSGVAASITGGGANMTTGIVLDVEMGAATAGTGLKVLTSGVFAGSNNMALFSANSATTTTGIVSVTGTGLTSGSALLVTGGGANITSGGKVIEIAMGAATAGGGLTVTTTGVYAGTGVTKLVADSATTGILESISGAGLTTGTGIKVTATAATLTTGRYFSANDGGLEVFGIGADGHLHTAQTTAPTIVVTNQAGITAAAVTAGSSDTCGNITTTGTSTGATVLDVTFNKTYTTAPKFVSLLPANAAAAMPNTGYIVSAISATGFTITVAAGGTYAATPAFRYFVIA